LLLLLLLLFTLLQNVSYEMRDTAFHSLAPKGRGWGEGVTMFPYRTAGTPSSHLLPHGEKE